MKLVTVGISFFNNEKSLLYAVKSVQDQTYKNLEILLINDGSSDNSLMIANQLSAADSRIKVISDGFNKGLISRLNQIIDQANGEYLARMDADDIIHPERIEKQIKTINERPRIDVVTTGMISLDNHLRPIGKRYCTHTEPDILKIFRNGEGILHASMLARTEWWRKNKYLEGFERAEDRELFTRTLKDSTYYNIPEPLYFYTDAPNMSLNKFTKSYISERKALKANWKGSLSKMEFIKLLIRSYLKQQMIKLIFLFGAQKKVFTSKNESLSLRESKNINKILRGITIN